MLLQAGSHAEAVHLGIFSVERDHYLQRSVCALVKRSGLIKYDGVCLRNSLQDIFRPLPSYCNGFRFTDGRKYGNRHCQLQCTGEVYHQHRQSLCHISGKQPGTRPVPAKCIRNQTCLPDALPCSPRTDFSFSDSSIMVTIFSYRLDPPAMLHQNGQLAFFYDGTCIYRSFPAVFVYRNGFAGQRCLIQHSLSADTTVPSNGTTLPIWTTI